jgi:hypothetical protein
MPMYTANPRPSDPLPRGLFPRGVTRASSWPRFRHIGLDKVSWGVTGIRGCGDKAHRREKDNDWALAPGPSSWAVGNRDSQGWPRSIPVVLAPPHLPRQSSGDRCERQCVPAAAWPPLPGQHGGQLIVVLGADLGEAPPIFVAEHFDEEDPGRSHGLPNGLGLPKLLNLPT